MKVAVIGLGLIGASIAKALAGKARVTGIDRDAKTLEQAAVHGVIDRGGPELSLAEGCDLAVIAVPVRSIVPVAKGLLPFLGSDTVITDTGSTKAEIVLELGKLTTRFVGSHPIAGKENPGYTASEPDLFTGKAAIITSTDETDKECIQRVRWLWESCGSKVAIMAPCTHDELMAKISHMPHLLSFVSMGIAKDVHIHRDLLGAGFRDFTRIAASDPVMWRDIFLANKGRILQLIDDYTRELGSIREMIEKDQSASLEEALRTYSSIRRDLYEDKR